MYPPTDAVTEKQEERRTKNLKIVNAKHRIFDGISSDGPTVNLMKQPVGPSINCEPMCLLAIRVIIPLYVLFVFRMIGCANEPPVISNVRVSVNMSQSVVTVSYDVSDLEDDKLRIACNLSDNDGETFLYPATNITGGVGYPVGAGTGKSVHWSFNPALVDLRPASRPAFRLKLVADDLQPVSIPDVLDGVSTARLSADLQTIDGPRNPNSIQHAAVKNLLLTRFANLGLKTREAVHPTGGTNVIGRLPGLRDEATTFIIGAHYDTVPGSPGADDNGSGVAGILEAARILSQTCFERTLVFIGFDNEELGLLGSGAYVQTQRPSYEQIGGVLNFEMTGFWSDVPNSQTLPSGFNLLFPDFYASVISQGSRGNFIASLANTSSGPLRSVFDSATATHVPALRCLSLAVSGNGEIAPDLRRSDHAPFWDAGYQALMLTDTAEFRNTNYHKASDTRGTLNLEFMANVLKATAATAMQLAGPLHAGVAVTDRVVADVRLRITFENAGTVRIEWDNPGVGMVLQRTHSLESALWQDVQGSEATNSINITVGASSGFFRLTQH